MQTFLNDDDILVEWGIGTKTGQIASVDLSCHVDATRDVDHQAVTVKIPPEVVEILRMLMMKATKDLERAELVTRRKR